MEQSSSCQFREVYMATTPEQVKLVLDICYSEDFRNNTAIKRGTRTNNAYVISLEYFPSLKFRSGALNCVENYDILHPRARCYTMRRPLKLAKVTCGGFKDRDQMC